MSKKYYGIEFRNPFAEMWGCYIENYCSEMLLNALSLYIVSNRPKEEHTDECIYKMLIANSAPYNSFNLLTTLFEWLEDKNPCAPELAYFKVFKAFPYKQQLSVIATLMAANFDSGEKLSDAFIKRNCYAWRDLEEFFTC